MGHNNHHIEYVNNGKEILAIIIRKSFSKKGIEFFTPDNFSQQVGYMRRPKGYVIKPHIHYDIPRTVSTLQEFLFIKKGKVRVDFYDDQREYLFSDILLEQDYILLIGFGHGFFMLEESEIIEVKQGPYLKKKDKKKFQSISNKKIIFRQK